MKDPFFLDEIDEDTPTKTTSDEDDPFFIKTEAAPETPKDSPWLISRPTTKDDVRRIALKYDVNPDELYELVPYLGGTREDKDKTSTELLKEGAGFLGESIGFSLPQWIIKKSHDDPKMRHAIDELQDVINENESWAREIAEIGAGLVTGFGVGTRLATAAAARGGKAAARAAEIGTGAVAGGAAGLGASTEGTEAMGLGMGVALGAGITAAAPKITEVAKKIGSKVEAVLKAKAEHGFPEERLAAQEANPAKIIEKAAIKLEANKERNEAFFDYAILGKKEARETLYELDSKVYITGELRAFTKVLGHETESLSDAKSFIRKHLKMHGEDFVRKQYENYKLYEASKIAMSEETTKKINVVNKDFKDAAIYFVQSARYSFRDIDERLGSKLEVNMDKMNQQYNRYQGALYRVTKDIKDVAKEIQKKGEDPAKIIDEIETLSYKPGSTAETLVKKFEEFGKHAEKLGVPIRRITDGTYIPRYVKDPIDAVVATINEINKYRNVPKMPKAKFDELAKAVQILTGDKIIIENKKQLLEAPQILYANLKKGDTDTLIASSILEREIGGEIPDFIREKDPIKLMTRWTHSVYRYAYMREGLDYVKTVARVAEEANDHLSADYLSKYLQDMATGVREGTLAAATKKFGNTVRYHYKMKASQADAQWKANMYELLSEVPSLTTSLLNNVYPNFLGMNVRATVTNLLSPFFMTVPEIGMKRGLSALASAYKDAVDIITNGRTIKLKDENLAKRLGKQVGSTHTTRNIGVVLENDGLLPRQWNTELVNILEEGIVNSAPIRMAKQTSQTLTNIAMIFYTNSEILNRFVATHAAKKLYDDILLKKADDFLQKLPKSYQQELAESENPRLALQQYLIGKTIFDYNKISMSQYGRTMGPVFSMFTKWPTEIAGDVIYKLRHGQGMEAVARYLGPLAVFSSLDAIRGEFEDRTRFEQVVFGKPGYANIVPASTFTSIFSGKVLKQPAVALVVDPVNALLKAHEKPEEMTKVLNNLFMSHMYGAWTIRILEDYAELDVPIVGKDKDK